MHKFKKVLLGVVILSTLTLAGCSPKIDATTPESLDASVKKVLEGKDKEDAALFQAGLESILNYAYAKTHEGRTLGDGGIFDMMVTASLNGKNNKATTEEMDKITTEILNGMTFKDVINSKHKYDQETAELVKQRESLMAEKRKEQQKKDEIAKQEYLKQQRINEKQRLVNLVTSIQSRITSTEKDIENYTARLQPFYQAQDAFESVTINDIELSKQDFKTYMKFSLDNDSEYDMMGYETRVFITTPEGNEVKRSFNAYGEKNIIPNKSTQELDESISSGVLKQVEDPSTLQTRSEIVSVSFIIDGKVYKTYPKDSENSKVPAFMVSSLEKAKASKTELEQQLVQTKQKLETF